MSYTKTNFLTGDVITATRMGVIETQYENAIADAFCTTYTVTLADVINTVVETTFLSFTVPANSMSDGDLIVIWLYALLKNNKGTDGSMTVKVNAGAGAQVSYGAQTIYNNAAEFGSHIQLTLMRVATGVVVGQYNPAATAIWRNDTALTYGTSVPTNFTSDFVVSYKATLDAADALFYIKPQSAQAIHFRRA